MLTLSRIFTSSTGFKNWLWYLSYPRFWNVFDTEEPGDNHGRVGIVIRLLHFGAFVNTRSSYCPGNEHFRRAHPTVAFPHASMICNQEKMTLIIDFRLFKTVDQLPYFYIGLFDRTNIFR